VSALMIMDSLIAAVVRDVAGNTGPARSLT